MRKYMHKNYAHAIYSLFDFVSKLQFYPYFLKIYSKSLDISTVFNASFIVYQFSCSVYSTNQHDDINGPCKSPWYMCELSVLKEDIGFRDLKKIMT